MLQLHGDYLVLHLIAVHTFLSEVRWATKVWSKASTLVALKIDMQCSLVYQVPCQVERHSLWHSLQ